MRRMESDYCFICGALNPKGLHLDITEGEGWARVWWIVEKPYVGYEDMLHGGIMASIMDDLMAHALYYTDLDVVTAHLELDYRAPAYVGEELLCEARVAKFGKGRSIRTEGTIRRGDTVIAQARGVMVIVKEPGRKGGREHDEDGSSDTGCRSVLQDA